MSEKTEIESARFCILMCWIGGIVGGLIVAVLVVRAWDMHALAGLFLGFLATLALAFLFYWLFCDEEKDADARKANAWVDSDKLPDATELSEDEVADTAPEVADVDSAEGESEPVVSETHAEPKTAAVKAAPETNSVIQPSKSLAGEEDLASRKGAWRYGEVPVSSIAERPVAQETGGDETQPSSMDGPRENGSDNLKEIKGVGPKLEALLNSLGIYHFDQVSGWTVAEVAWMDSNLKGFKGRVSRDTWVDQARILSSGGETEFSKRVEDGDVY